MLQLGRQSVKYSEYTFSLIIKGQRWRLFDGHFSFSWTEETQERSQKEEITYNNSPKINLQPSPKVFDAKTKYNNNTLFLHFQAQSHV